MNNKIEAPVRGTIPEPAVASIESGTAAPPTVLVIAAFAAIYIIWGSTYLAIRYAIESIPPFIMAGTRFVAAGGVLYAIARSCGAARPTRREWRDAAIAGGLLLAVGNGGVTWSERLIPSGVAALLVALVPLWILLLDWLRPGGARPRSLAIAGLAVGVFGVALLARNQMSGGNAAYARGVLVLICASLGWAAGSLFYRHATKPNAPLLAVAMQLLTGGGILLALAAVRGEMRGFALGSISWTSGVAWLYLTLIGALVGFTAYVWLLKVSTPARVSTYAFVNPLIAVLLGCTLGREALSPQVLSAGALIVIAVVLIVRSGIRKASDDGAAAPPPDRYRAESAAELRR
jgi:drug/metabolite transporter (DMT)-like permease